MLVLAGDTNVTTYFKMRLTATSLEATGLTPADFDLQFVRSGAVPSTKVDAAALAGVGDAHSDNTVIEVDATDQPGLYRVDWPDSAFAVGVREVILTAKVATAFTEELRVELSASIGAVLLQGVTHTGAVIPTITTLTGHTVQTGDNFPRLGAPAGASVSADIAAVKVETALIVVDTGAILIDTADMQPKLGTPAADVSADIAAVKAETALIVADTNELQTDNVPGLIAALNDLSAAQVNTEVDTALIDYDGPTNAEMITRTILSTEYFDPINDTVVNVTNVTTLAGHIAQTGDSFALANGANGFVATKTDTAAILTDTDSLDSTKIPDTISLANINAEVDTALATSTYAEPSSRPPAMTSIQAMLHWLFTLSVNLGLQTSTLKTLRNDANSANIATSVISDDGTTFTRNKWT